MVRELHIHSGYVLILKRVGYGCNTLSINTILQETFVIINNKHVLWKKKRWTELTYKRNKKKQNTRHYFLVKVGWVGV